MAEHGEHATVFDSGQQYIGKVYAKALLGATESAGNSQQVLEEFDAFVDEVLNKLPKVDATLSSPRVPTEAKMSIIDKIIGGKVSGTFWNFLNTLRRHDRLNCIRAIRDAVHQQFNEATGRVEVQITSATPLSDELRNRVAEGLSARLQKTVELKTAIDAGILGGMVIRVGDTVYDASVVNQLSRLRDETIQKTSQAIKQSVDRFATTDEADYEV